MKNCDVTHTFQDVLPLADICGWKPFLEREDLLVWRKEDEVFHGLYAYKGMYCLLKYTFLCYQKNCSDIYRIFITLVNSLRQDSSVV
jgi:hypothetical protein